MKKTLRSITAFFLKFLPSPDYIYNTLLRPKPLRYLSNKILLFLIPESIALPEGTLHLNPEDPRISGSIAMGFYEKFETALLRSILKPGMTVVNVGANMGYYVFIAAKRVGDTGKVIGFEPEPRNFAILKKNAEGLGNVEVRQEGVSDKPGEMTLYLSMSNMGAHTMMPEKSFKKSIQVKVVVLDSLVSKADLLIMDIEGAEPFAFAGMKKLLDTDMKLLFEFNPRMIEMGGNDSLELLKMLRGHGYEMYDVNAEKEKLEKVGDLAEFLKHVEGTEARLANLYCVKHLAGTEIGLP